MYKPEAVTSQCASVKVRNIVKELFILQPPVILEKVKLIGCQNLTSLEAKCMMGFSNYTKFLRKNRFIVQLTLNPIH